MNLKSNLFYLALGILSAGAFMTSCSDKDEPDNDTSDFNSTETIFISEGDLNYDSDGIWALNYTNSLINIEGYEFSHASPYENYANGFTPSKLDDMTYYEGEMYNHSYACVAGGGVQGKGTPYLVGYWDSYTENSDENQNFDSKSCRIYDEELQLFMPVSVMVNNNTYMYYYVLYGNGFGDKFKEGDYVSLIAHGVHQDGTESTASIDLVNIKSNDDIEGGIITEWTAFDLSSLGICTGIYFTMESSDSGEYGMNPPSYFCIDKLVLKN